MQSTRHKHFSRVSTAVFVIVTLIVVVWLFINISGDARQALNQTDSSLHTGSTTSTLSTSAVPAATTPVAPIFTLIQTPKGPLRVEVVATDISREKGLSGRASLPKDSGMLFVFPKAGVYGFWMKDMQMSLDMIWIGADQKVIGVVPGVSPGTYPEIFYPPTDILYVLELPQGSAAEHAITTGTLLAFPTR